MTGILVTGHGHFPTGLLSAVELVAGKQEQMMCVDFEAGQGTEELKKNLTSAIQKLETSEILILTDLLGGTPFNVSVMLKKEQAEKEIRVLAGTNLAMLVEAVFSRSAVDLGELTEQVKKAGTDGVINADILEQDDCSEEAEDGI